MRWNHEASAALEAIRRIRALFSDRDRGRRGAKAGTGTAHLRADFQTGLLWKAGVEIHLSPTESRILEVLVSSRGIPVRSEELLLAVWGPGCGDKTPCLRTYIRRLRSKLEDSQDKPEWILTVPWIGYRLRAEISVARRCGAAGSQSASCRDGRLNELVEVRELKLAQMRKAIRANAVSFPSQVPTFDRHDRADLQWKLVQLYFVRGWSCQDIASRYGLCQQRIRQILTVWKRRAVETGYIQYIPPIECFEIGNTAKTGRPAGLPSRLDWRANGLSQSPRMC